VKFALEDLEDAALEISQEILGSRSPYLPSMLPSLGSHLELRSQHLRALIQHLRTGAFGHVSKQVLWRLLQDAEKCEAARAVWDMRNEHLREDPENGDGVLGAVIGQYVPTEDTDVTGNDPVRTWFQREVVQIGQLLRHVKKSLALMPDKGKKNQLSLAVSDSEANDIIIGALERAWQFRVDNAKLYELSGEHGIDKNGLLEKSDGYLAPWTSDALLLEALSIQRDLSEAAIKALWGPTEDPKRQDVVSKLGLQLVHLAEICCRSFEERADWCEQQSAVGDDILQEGRNVRERYLRSRGGWIKPLVNYGLIEHAYGIAEDYQDYRTLVEICSGELLKTEVSLVESIPAQQNSETVNELKEKKAEVGKRLEGYFERFGEPFAIEMYEYLVENGKLQTLLSGFESWRERYLSPFLRGNPKYAKLSWIHDVSLGDYGTAANTLFSIATKSESMLLNQRIELSIGKLAKLAALENASASDIDVVEEIEAYDIRLEIVKIQQRLYSAVKHITHSAIDVDAAVHLATEEYARKLKKLPALRDLFRTSFKQLVSGGVMVTEDLVELLTLMEPTEGELLDGESFYWALRVIGLAGLPRAEIENAEKTIWRRCFLRDEYVPTFARILATDANKKQLDSNRLHPQPHGRRCHRASPENKRLHHHCTLLPAWSLLTRLPIQTQEPRRDTLLGEPRGDQDLFPGDR
jgi:nuclear pore complex protein Nup133